MIRIINRSTFAILLFCAATAQAGNPFTTGKIWFIQGQDTGTLTEFKKAVLDVNNAFPKPDGTTFYTNLAIDEVNAGAIAGFQQTGNFGSGRVDVQRQANEYQGALAVGLWLKDVACDTSSTAELRNFNLRSLAGEPTIPKENRDLHREYLNRMLSYLWETQRDIFLRIGYEFDGPWNCYTPETYKNAFRAIKRRIDELGFGSRIHTVWQSASYPFDVSFDPRMTETHSAANPGHLDLWYPGDAFVDIVGGSFFLTEEAREGIWSDKCLAQFNLEFRKTPRELRDELVNFARTHNKPVMIAEAAPQGFDLAEGSARCIFPSLALEEQTDLTADQIWNQWYQPFFDFVYENADTVKAVAYINTHWQEQPQWSCTEDNCSEGFWGDTRLQANDEILERFESELAKSAWRTSPDLTEPFTAPFIVDRGRLEAEFASTPVMWANGDELNGFGTNLADASGSNQGTYIIFADGGSITFDRGVRRSSSLVIRYASVTEGTFAVLVDGRVEAEVPFTNTDLTYVDTIVDVEVAAGADVTLQLQSGFVLWFDYVDMVLGDGSERCPDSHPLSCEGDCYVDSGQAGSAECFVSDEHRCAQ